MNESTLGNVVKCTRGKYIEKERRGKVAKTCMIWQGIFIKLGHLRVLVRCHQMGHQRQFVGARSRLIYRDTSLELQPIAKGTTIWIYYGWPSVRPLIVLP